MSSKIVKSKKQMSTNQGHTSPINLRERFQAERVGEKEQTNFCLKANCMTEIYNPGPRAVVTDQPGMQQSYLKT